MVAQTVVGASSCFVLVFTHNRHSTDLFRKDCYLSKKEESSRLLTKVNHLP
jgi:hypothetical protein